jgi:hypothetical protein
MKPYGLPSRQRELLISMRHFFLLFVRNWVYTGLPKIGLIGGASLWTRQILLNRQTPALHAAFASVLGTSHLLINHDRYGMLRPAKEHPERATLTNLHLDMNPWRYAIGLFCYHRLGKFSLIDD